MQLLCSFVIAIVLFAALAPAQVTTQQFESLREDAKRLLNERRFSDAIESLKSAYKSRSDPNVMGLMVMPYFASGLFPEGQDALATAVGDGGQAEFVVRHNHSRGYCIGTLIIGQSHVQFLGSGPSDSFDVVRDQIAKIRVFTVDYDSGSSPIIRLKTPQKNWNFTYALYGGAGQYEVSLTGDLVYRGDELEKAQRASGIIASVIQQAPTAPKHEDTEINITAGMTKDEVTAKIGQPHKSVVFGEKTIFKYADITVEFLADKVVEVKAN